MVTRARPLTSDNKGVKLNLPDMEITLEFGQKCWPVSGASSIGYQTPSGHGYRAPALKSLKEIFPHAYHNSPKTKDKNTTRHGTSIFSKEVLEKVHHYNTNTLDATTAYDKTRKVHIVCVYRYPTSSVPQFITDLKEIQATQTDEKKVIIGDFIINILKKAHQTIKNLCNELKTKQLINTATTKHNTIVDHIHTNIGNTKLAGVIKTYYSDHEQIFIQI